MFCKECGRELKENEECHCLENIVEQPNVKIARQSPEPAFGLLTSEYDIYAALNKINKEEKKKKEKNNDKK